MALAGRSAILIWNDVVPDALDDFYAWHNGEHLPERLGIPGFIRGRRYVRAAGSTPQAFFTLYETASAEVMTSPAYMARLNAPTPWSTKIFKSFRNMQRALCVVTATQGPGAGGIMATIAFSAGHAPAEFEEIAASVVPAIASRPGITGVHLCVADDDATAVKSAEQSLRGGDDRPPSRALLVEGCDLERVTAAVEAARGTPAMGRIGATITGYYRLEITRQPIDGAVG
jgi:hypothetical protein